MTDIELRVGVLQDFDGQSCAQYGYTYIQELPSILAPSRLFEQNIFHPHDQRREGYCNSQAMRSLQLISHSENAFDALIQAVIK